MARFTWDAALGRYRDADGVLVPLGELRAAAQTVVSTASDQVAVLAQRFAAGGLTANRWETQMAQVLRDAHLSAGALSGGGWAQLETFKASVVDRLTDEFLHLGEFKSALGDLSDAQIAARSQLYVGSVWKTYTDVARETAQGAGHEEERNVLDDAAAHCDECEGLGDEWVPIGTLPLPGDRTCAGNCRCELEYRGGAEDTGDEEAA